MRWFCETGLRSVYWCKHWSFAYLALVAYGISLESMQVIMQYGDIWKVDDGEAKLIIFIMNLRSPSMSDDLV
jgi:hypothetical protein